MGKLTIHHATRGTTAQEVACIRLVAAELIHRLDEGASRLAELDHTCLQVIERALYQTVLLLVMS
jgi:hypothetical protein